jgi:hypothetical protein
MTHKNLNELFAEEYEKRDKEAKRPTKISMLEEVFSHDGLLRLVAGVLVNEKPSCIARVRESINALLNDEKRCPDELFEKYGLGDLRILHPQFLKAVSVNLAARTDDPLFAEALGKMKERSTRAKLLCASRKNKKNK